MSTLGGSGLPFYCPFDSRCRRRHRVPPRPVSIPRDQPSLFSEQRLELRAPRRSAPKRRRPPSLLLDESPLKVTLRVNSIKRVHPDKDNDDAFAELEGAIEAAKKEAEKGDDNDDGSDDNDGDGVDNYDERQIGTDPEDPNSTPTDEQIEELRAQEEAEEAAAE